MAPLHLATEAGIGILRAGGSAVDAAITTNAVLAVVVPSSCGIGGDAFWLIWEAATGREYALNGSGRAPASADPAAIRDQGLDSLPLRGPMTITVPGAVRSWGDAHRRFGRLPREQVLAPAIELARDGFPAWDGFISSVETTLRAIDPVVGSAMAHYQYETLHPFHDGIGRIGRLLVVLHLQQLRVLSEATLTVSPWFQGRRAAYDDRLLAVSTNGDWDAFVGFFAQGLEAAAQLTRRQMNALGAVQGALKDVVRASALRADSAHALIDLAIANPTFTVRRVESELSLSYGRANKLVGQLVELGVLSVVDPRSYKRRFYAPSVLDVLAAGGA